jgi:hypothetical protein
MRFWANLLAGGLQLAVSIAVLADEKPAVGTAGRTILQATLTAPGSPRFPLKATIVDSGDPDFSADIEIFWVSRDKWRRTIRSPEFKQTVIVNRDMVLEQDSDDYFPLSLQTFVTAIFDPQRLLAAIKPEDRMEIHPIWLNRYSLREPHRAALVLSESRSMTKGI